MPEPSDPSGVRPVNRLIEAPPLWEALDPLKGVDPRIARIGRGEPERRAEPVPEPMYTLINMAPPPGAGWPWIFSHGSARACWPALYRDGFAAVGLLTSLGLVTGWTWLVDVGWFVGDRLVGVAAVHAAYVAVSRAVDLAERRALGPSAGGRGSPLPP